MPKKTKKTTVPRDKWQEAADALDLACINHAVAMHMLEEATARKEEAENKKRIAWDAYNDAIDEALADAEDR